MKEIEKLREDYASYASGDILLITYEDDSNAGGSDDAISKGAGGFDGIGGGASKEPGVHRPRSMLFRAFVEFNHLARSSRSRLPTSKNDVAGRRWAKMPSLRRKRRGSVDDKHIAEGETSGDTYDPPNIV